MSRATGRHTRPKKLNAKQNVQIFREDQVEPQPDYDSQRAQIETGVEKAEEAVSCLHPASRLPLPSPPAAQFLPVTCPLQHCLVITSWQPPTQSHSLIFDRNTIFNKPSKPQMLQKRMQKSKMLTFQLHLPSQAMSNMIFCIRKAFNSPPHISGLQPQSKIVPAWRIAWMKKMNLP